MYLGISPARQADRHIKMCIRDRDRLEQCKNIPNYKKSAQIFFCGLGSACFCYLFGGNWLDFVFLEMHIIEED